MTTDEQPDEGTEPASDDAANTAAAAAIVQAMLAQSDRLPESGPIRGNVDGSVVVDVPAGPLVIDRPTFGQMKKIIRAGARLDDDLQALSYRAKANVTANRARWEKIPGVEMGGDGTPSVTVTDENTAALIEMKAESRAVLDAIEDDQFAAISRFWSTVFDLLLALDPVPAEDDWPAPLADPTLHRKVIAHWRHVPVGPG